MLAFIMFGAGASATEQPPPVVVATIKPLHSLVAGVMQGVALPALLVSGAGSPHGFALKPSQARLLQRADIVFWVGADLERFLTKSLKTLAKGAKVVALAKTIALLPYRKEGLWRTAQEPAERAAPERHGALNRDAGDPHFWLDPLRARSVVPVIVAALSERDPLRAARYRSNGHALTGRLDRLHKRLKGVLAPVRMAPYLVFHDAYQYFEARYRLNAVGTVTLDPELRTGAQHFVALRRKIKNNGVRCIFREPQFKPSSLAVLSDASDFRIGVLDPLGASLGPGSDAYFDLLEVMADNLVSCLSSGTE